MSQSVTLNATSYPIPETGESAWGAVVTAYLVALSTGVLSKAGGSFTLTADADFGASYGLKAAYYKSRGTVAAAGVVRLANLETVSWRNAANGGDLALRVNGSDWLQFAGVDLVDKSTAQTVTNKTIDADSNTVSNIVNANIKASAAIAYSKLALTGSIVNADIGASAAIAYSKLALTGSIVNADIGASAAIAYSKLDLATSIVNADISGSAAIAYSKLNLATSIVNADISGSAAIAYSKLNLSGAIVNADVSGSAGIAYSKLNLATSIVNADISGSAAIARSKIATGTASHVLINDGSGNMSSEAQLAITRGGTGAATANAALNALLPTQTSNSGKILSTDGSDTSWIAAFTNPMATTGDMVYGGASGVSTKLATGATTGLLHGGNGAVPSWSLIVNADVSGSAAIAYSKLNLATSIVNADISGSAAIAYSKLALTGAILNADLAGSIADSKLSTISTAGKVSGAAITSGDIATTGKYTSTRSAAANDEAIKVTTAALSSNKQAIISVTDNGSDRAAIGVRYILGGAPSQSDGFLRLNQGQSSTQNYVYFDGSSNLRYSTDNDNVGQNAGTVIGTQTSDGRLKKNVRDAGYGLADLLKLRPVKFKWTGAKASQEEEVGFVAQEVAAVCPEAVYDTSCEREGVKNVLAMKYHALMPLVVAALKEVAAKVDQLERGRP